MAHVFAFGTNPSFQITDCPSHFQGEVKTRVLQMVALMYGFKGGNGRTIIEHNVQLARELKTNFAFVYSIRSQHFSLSACADRILSRNEDLMATKVCTSTRSSKMLSIRSGSITRKTKVFVFLNSIAQSQKSDVPSCSQLYVSLFKLTSASVTFIPCKIECCIDKFANGTRKDIQFTAKEYEPIYVEHLSNLDKFDDHTKAHGIVPKLLMALHDNGWCVISPILFQKLYSYMCSFNVKVDPFNDHIGRAMSLSAFDAAIEEYNNGDNGSDSEMDDDN